jgi:hypothetical protein
MITPILLLAPPLTANSKAKAMTPKTTARVVLMLNIEQIVL